jgi:hypothetical protein
MSDWKLRMTAEPIVPAWTSESECNTNGAELQRAILGGFAADKQKNAAWTKEHELPAGIKQRLYPVLRSRGITVRDWFLANAEKEFGLEERPRKRPFRAKKSGHE